MRLRAFACSFFRLSARGANFFRCVNFFCFKMASPLRPPYRDSIVALCPIHGFGRRARMCTDHGFFVLSMPTHAAILSR
jgi:hypothetical protein